MKMYPVKHQGVYEKTKGESLWLSEGEEVPVIVETNGHDWRINNVTFLAVEVKLRAIDEEQLNFQLILTGQNAQVFLNHKHE